VLGVGIQKYQQLVDKCRVLIVYFCWQQVKAVEQDNVQIPLPRLQPLPLQFAQPPMFQPRRIIKGRNVVTFRFQLGR
jgi:hypothetical protein